MLKLKLIVGSTREGRSADAVLRWLKPAVEQHAGFETEILDLRDWPLPMFQEHPAKMGDLRHPTYSTPLVQKWNETIQSGDAFILLTPEYNHSTSGVLKNAIDSVFFSFGFRQKPVAMVGYSVGVAAGARAVMHLNEIMLECDAVPLRTPVLIPSVLSAFDGEGKPVSPTLGIGLQVVLDDLAWTGEALAAARAKGQLAPSNLRVRAALTALQEKK